MWRVPSSIGRRLSIPSTGNGWEMESLGMARISRGEFLRVAVGAMRGERKRWRLVRHELCDQLPGDRREAHPHHRMARRAGQVREALESSDVGQAVGRAWTQLRQDRCVLE